jgi:membrane protein YqaA with SNARE-associated domain
MSVGRWSVSLVALLGIAAATIAAATIWLVFTDPVTVANAVSTGDVGPVVQALGTVIANALRGLFRYL